MKKITLIFAVVLGLQFAASTVMARHHNKPGNQRQCDNYASRMADRDNSSSSRTLKGAVVGAASGALVGAVVDGGSGAAVGGAAGAGVGAIGGNIRNDRKWRDSYDKYYRDCMRGRR